MLDGICSPPKVMYTQGATDTIWTLYHLTFNKDDTN